MARMARAVAPGIPHHVTQRGNRRHGNIIRENLCRKVKEPLPLRQIGEIGQQGSVWLFA